MQDVNDDMDGLLRRAANGYPLNTNSADWNKVLNALHSSENVEEDHSAEDNSFITRKKFPDILLLLLLLSVPLLCVDYALVNNRIIPGQETSKINTESTPRKASYNHANTAAKATNERLLFIESKSRNKDYPADNIYKKQFGSNVKLKVDESELSAFSSDPKLVTKDFLDSTNKSFNKNNGLPETGSTAETRKPEKGYSINVTTDKPVISSPLLKTKPNVNNTFDTGASNKIEERKETSLNGKKDKRWYAGLLAGPDISTIKFQKADKTGFSAGLLIGYALNKKLSIETGVLWDKKFYYTEGKYFNPKNTSIPSYIRIDDVNGNCGMIEWPVNLSYTLKSFNKGYLTATTGISSYFMKRENYSYTYQRNGTEHEWNLSYKNSSTNLLSVASVGFGYNHNISKSYMLRIQPYIKIPVSGIGMGRLPITSSGVYIVLTKKIL